MNNQCILLHDFDCGCSNYVCAWSDWDYSDPKTDLVKRLPPNTKAKILDKKSPGVLVEISDGTQYWICEWDVHSTE
jgi:hypothetical protein